MKTEVRKIGGGRQALEDFAETHGLVMQVNERSKTYGLPRWHASFKDVEVADGGMLTSAFGDGDTPEAAIADYARHIEGQRLVYRAFRPERKEFQAPNDLTVDPAERRE